MKKLFFLIVVIIALNSNAEVKLPAIFSDNMMLQQNSDVAIWGWAKPASKINIQPSWSDINYTMVVDESGKWKTKIKTPQYGGPYTIIISDGDPITISNVLIGEVWLCSGQSNMEMPMKGFVNQPVEEATDAVVRSENKNIRMFKVKRNAQNVPLDNCEGSWVEATPESVREFSAVGYFFGRLVNQITKMPVGLINVSLGGSAIQGWMNPHALEGTEFKIPKKDDPIKSWGSTPTLLFNAMLNPIIGCDIRGVIWYQGESNHKNPDNYTNLMKKMVNEWRSLWSVGEFPFYFVQIAPYRYNDGVNSALLREAQLNAVDQISNSGIVINMDADSPENIHPSAKKQVGERLAYLALARTYGLDGFPYCSPALKSFEIKGSIVELTFETPIESKLTSFGKEIKGFSIAGENKYFERAKADISGNKITVFSASVKQPVAVRYAFDDDAQAEVFTRTGLPLSSFRTDNWQVK
jgi:sialate O-acetylesterase